MAKVDACFEGIQILDNIVFSLKTVIISYLRSIDTINFNMKLIEIEITLIGINKLTRNIVSKVGVFGSTAFFAAVDTSTKFASR